ncbi:hypothetical protein CSKR_105110 [Clonorchis sinensis]|uniref:Uncharacterized protein n=1 Tax=Clonorchis sinensis TaxID=79923 RepID=A0A8T1MN56_CLOSI|nr:hypothetical protein CSKR_105110 [Clonorchis sinensis]
MDTSGFHTVLERLQKYDLVLLDRTGLDVLGSTLIALGQKNLKPFDSFQSHSDATSTQKVAFLLFCPLSVRVLEHLCRICSVYLQLTHANVFTPYVASAVTQHLDQFIEQPDYPVGPLKYISKKFGAIHLEFEHIPFFSRLTFYPDLISLPKFHEFGEETEPLQGAFHDLNTLLWSIKALEEVYSLGPNAERIASEFASEFAPALERKKHLHSLGGSCSASVIFVNDLTICDPVACLGPYIKPGHLLDLVFTELSPDGHSVKVCWDTLMNHTTQDDSYDLNDKDKLEPFCTDLLQTEFLGTHHWLSQQLPLKEQDAMKALHNTLMDIAGRVHHDLPEFSKAPQTRAQWAALFHQHVKDLIGPVCKSDHLNLLDALQLVMASSTALSAFSKRVHCEPDPDKDEAPQSNVNLEKLLSRFERSLLVASQLDAKAIAQLSEPDKCEPVLLNALREAKILTYLDDRFLFVVYLMTLMPVQSQVSPVVWEAVEDFFNTGQRIRKIGPGVRGNLIPTFMTTKKLISNLINLWEQRRSLPSYNNVWTNQPRYRSPLVQLMKDLLGARTNPNEPSPALKGLKHHTSASGSAKWLTGLSRYIRIAGSTAQESLPYTTDYVILVLLGSVPFALIRDLLEVVKSQNSSSPLKLKIIANRFTGGLAGLSGFFSI